MKKISLLLLLFNFTILFAQKEVTGIVTDNVGEPIIGANIVEKGKWRYF